MSKRLQRNLLVGFVVLLAAGGWLVQGMAKIGTGYAAKQLCSGVYVSGLPADFILRNDIEPRLATVPIMSRFITTEVGPASATARGLGVAATATYRRATGCTLHGLADSDVARPPNRATPTPAVVMAPGLETIIDAAFVEPEDGGRQTLAMVVMHRGQVVAERYAEPVGAATPLQGWSMNKSLMASFIGLQVASGEMKLADSVTSGLAAQGVPGAAFEGLADEMTLKHLLSMTSGIDFSERYFPGDNVTEMLYGYAPMWTVPASQGQRHPPGSVFSYSSGDTNLVSFLWQASLAGEPYPAWLQRKVFEPLGLHTPTLEPDVSGIQVGSSFAFLTARDWARVGQWWLDAWHGRAANLSQQWQRLAVTPGVSEGGKNYGLGFWLNTDRLFFSQAPANTFHAGGNSGQFVVVIPDRELVVVRLGLTLDPAKVALDGVLGDLQSWAIRRPVDQ